MFRDLAARRGRHSHGWAIPATVEGPLADCTFLHSRRIPIFKRRSLATWFSSCRIWPACAVELSCARAGGSSCEAVVCSLLLTMIAFVIFSKHMTRWVRAFRRDQWESSPSDRPVTALGGDESMTILSSLCWGSLRGWLAHCQGPAEGSSSRQCWRFISACRSSKRLGPA